MIAIHGKERPCLPGKRERLSRACARHEGIGYGGVEVKLHKVLTFVLDVDEWSASPPPLYPSGKSPCYPLNRSLVVSKM
jgi:hypothetical protein